MYSLGIIVSIFHSSGNIIITIIVHYIHSNLWQRKTSLHGLRLYPRHRRFTAINTDVVDNNYNINHYNIRHVYNGDNTALREQNLMFFYMFLIPKICNGMQLTTSTESIVNEKHVKTGAKYNNC